MALWWTFLLPLVVTAINTGSPDVCSSQQPLSAQSRDYFTSFFSSITNATKCEQCESAADHIFHATCETKKPCEARLLAECSTSAEFEQECKRVLKCAEQDPAVGFSMVGTRCNRFCKARRAVEEAQARAKAEAARKAEEARQRMEEERRRIEEELRRREEEKRRKEEEEARAREEERQRKEEEKRRKEEERLAKLEELRLERERKKAEEEAEAAKKKAEKEAEQQRRRQALQDAAQRASEAVAKTAAAQAAKAAADAAKQKVADATDKVAHAADVTKQKAVDVAKATQELAKAQAENVKDKVADATQKAQAKLDEAKEGVQEMVQNGQAMVDSVMKEAQELGQNAIGQMKEGYQAAQKALAATRAKTSEAWQNIAAKPKTRERSTAGALLDLAKKEGMVTTALRTDFMHEMRMGVSSKQNLADLSDKNHDRVADDLCRCVADRYKRQLNTCELTFEKSVDDTNLFSLALSLSFQSYFLAGPFFKGDISSGAANIEDQAVNRVDSCKTWRINRVNDDSDPLFRGVPNSLSVDYAVDDAEGVTKHLSLPDMRLYGDQQVEAMKSEGYDASSAASVVGDPHVQNLQGEKFDIMVTGRVSLLEYPRKAVNHKVRVNAFVARVGRCEQTFIEQIDIMGSWVSSSSGVSRISIAARPGNNHSFVIRHDDAEWNPANSPAVFRFPENFQIDVQLNRHHDWNFLEISAHGLQSLQEEVGGVLGLDSHDTISTERTCEGLASTFATVQLIEQKKPSSSSTCDC